MKHDSEDRFFFELSEDDVPAPPVESRTAPEVRCLALIGCFRPRQCGIATYTADRSEEHTSELQSLMRISYAVFCLKKKKKNKIYTQPHTMTHTNRRYAQKVK